MAFGIASRSMSMAPSTDCSTSVAWGGIRPACCCMGSTLSGRRRPPLIFSMGTPGVASSMRSGRCWKSSGSAIGGRDGAMEGRRDGRSCPRPVSLYPSASWS